MTRALRGRLGPDPTPYTHEGSRSWTRTPKHGGALQSPVAECRARAHATPSARVRERAQAECGAGSGLGGGVREGAAAGGRGGLCAKPAERAVTARPARPGTGSRGAPSPTAGTGRGRGT